MLLVGNTVQWLLKIENNYNIIYISEKFHIWIYNAKQLEVEFQRDTCTAMFIATLTIGQKNSSPSIHLLLKG